MTTALDDVMGGKPSLGAGKEERMVLENRLEADTGYGYVGTCLCLCWPMRIYSELLICQMDHVLLTY